MARYRRKRSSVGAVVAALLAAAGAEAADRDLAAIQKRGTLQVILWTGTADDLFSSRGGAAPGFEREILEGFATVQRVKLEIVPVSSLDERMAALAAGRGDMVVGGVVRTGERAQQAQFSGELFPIRHVVVTRRPHRVVRTLEELRAERVGTLKGSSWAEQVAAAQVPPANVDGGFTTPQAVVSGLRQGRVSAIVMSVRTAMLERKQDPELQLGLFVGPITSSCFGVGKGHGELLAALNAYIESLRRSAAWSRLVVKYFGDDALDVLRKSRGEP